MLFSVPSNPRLAICPLATARASPSAPLPTARASPSAPLATARASDSVLRLTTCALQMLLLSCVYELLF